MIPLNPQQRNFLIEWLTIASGMLLLFGILIAGHAAAAVVGILGLVGGLMMARSLGGTQERRFLIGLFGAAYVLRLLAVIFTFAVLAFNGYPGLGDEVGYDQLARDLLLYWRGAGPAVIDNWGGNYTYLIAGIYSLFGYDPLIPKIMNASLGAMLPCLVWYLASRLFPEKRAARLAGLFVVFMPSLIFWSALNIRDALGLLLIAGALIGAQLFSVRPNLLNYLLMLSLWVVQRDIRYWVFVPLGWLLPLGVLFVPRVSRPARVLAFSATLGAVLVIPFWFGLGFGGVKAIQGSLINQERSAMAVGAKSAFVPTPTLSLPPTPIVTPLAAVTPPAPQATALSPQPTPVVSVSSPGDVPAVAVPALPIFGAWLDKESTATLMHIPVGLAFVIAAPFPWALYNWLAQALFPEMLAWYFLFLAALYALFLTRHQWREWFLVFAYCGGIMLIMAVIEGNVGTLARHRAVLITPFVLIFSAQGLISLWKKWESTKSFA